MNFFSSLAEKAPDMASNVLTGAVGSALGFGQQKSLMDIQNAYNDPSAQVARLRRAGLSPWLVNGQSSVASVPSGSSANVESAPSKLDYLQTESNVRMQDAQAHQMEVMTDAQRILNSYLDKSEQKRLSLLDTQIDSTVSTADYNRALADSVRSKLPHEVEGIKISNKLNDYTIFRMRSLLPLDIAQSKAQTSALLASAVSSYSSASLARAQSANEREELAVHTFRSNLAKQGINPDGDWVRTLIGFIGSLFGDNDKNSGVLHSVKNRIKKSVEWYKRTHGLYRYERSAGSK